MNSYRDAAHYLAQALEETSCLLFSKAALGGTVARFQQGFPGETTYAVKANPHPEILAALYALGITEYDAASVGEIEQLHRQLPDARINFNNPVRSQTDLRRAYQEYGVRSFVVDDACGLQQLKALQAHDIEATIRLKLAHQQAAYDFGSKFGAARDSATQLLKEASSTPGIASVSLAFHPGSQCTSIDVYSDYIAACAEVVSAASVTIERLNVGGGFPLQYAGIEVPPLERYFEAIQDSLRQHFHGPLPRVLCEPGRALVGPSCSLMCDVVHVRESGDVFLSDGVYGSLQEQFLIDSRLPLRVWRDGSEQQASGPDRALFGPTCDPSDRLSARYQLVEDLRPGDKVEFGLLGAYGSATATRFNGINPAGYALVENGFTVSRQGIGHER